MAKVTPTSDRKDDHIRINLDEDVRSGLTTGLERYRFRHNAIPEIDLDQVDPSGSLFGKTFKLPLLISSMTGGVENARRINRRLARAAQEIGVAMGVGSQRAAIESPDLAETYQIRPHAPDVLLFANLGAVQLNYGYTIDHCRRVVEMIQADALILHFNPLQEALQPEGDSNFEDLLPKIEQVCTQLDVPVAAKEVGWGISADAARRLVEVGVQAIDVAGAGGTSWSQVEMHRAETEAQRRLAGAFVDWGIPTAEALKNVREALPDVPVFASGGLRTGTDVAKCLALGADLCGMASPFLKAASHSSERVIEVLQEVKAEVRVCMFATGSPTLSALRVNKLIQIE
jgi:isopentenyl-diphosphate delta-isomerase